jgi:2-polyprenyl-3-methyl-5-hydroxy-6-metoxy-1,4-benzoquinol methylase
VVISILEPIAMNHVQDTKTDRAEHEIEHGKWLAAGDTEAIWGWGTPAGQLRARRRGGLVAEAAGLRPGARALEVGCGTGLFTEIFAASGANIIAVDISEELLDKARQRGLPVPRVRFLAKPFEECALDGPFDAVIGSSILHHLDYKAALAKMCRLLRPGGVLAFAEPNYLNPQVWLERNFRQFFPYTSPDETAFVRWQLRRDLLGAGFEAPRITPFDWLHPSTPRLLIPCVRAIGTVLEYLPLLREFSGSLLITARRPLG